MIIFYLHLTILVVKYQLYMPVEHASKVNRYLFVYMTIYMMNQYFF